MKKLLFFAVLATVAVSCTNENYLGVNENPQTEEPAQSGISFSSLRTNVTRAGNPATGQTAADLLGRQFRVYGALDDGTPIFDNYVVDYVGAAVDPDADPTNGFGWSYLGQTSLGLNPATQDLKYWDLDAPAYHFVAVSGLADDVRLTSADNNSIVVDATNRDKLFVSDRVTAKYNASTTGKTKNVQYGKGPVTLTFKRVQARVRFGIYETIPGYAVKDVKFYYGDNYLAQAGTSTKTVAGLRGDFPVAGTYNFTYDANNQLVATLSADLNERTLVDNFLFGELEYTTAASSLTTGGFMKEDGTVAATGDEKFLATTSAVPTWARKDAVLDGVNVANSVWQTVLPYTDNAKNMVLRADFTLVAIDGVGAPIEVKGASAVVPAKYAQWKPNYAYTYIFKISDKTNGTTGPTNPNPSDPDTPNPNPEPGVDPGLYPIQFDAEVSTVEDYTQETITGITSLGGDAITTYSKTSDVTNAGEYRVGETIEVSSYSFGRWQVAYSQSEPTEQGVADNNTYTYTTLAGAATPGRSINDNGVTSASFKAEKAGYYIVRLTYLPIGLTDEAGYYVDVFKVVKVVD